MATHLLAPCLGQTVPVTVPNETVRHTELLKFIDNVNYIKIIKHTIDRITNITLTHVKVNMIEVRSCSWK